MQSFRSELEFIPASRRVLVEKDLVDLEQKIFKFRNGQIDEEKFRSLRLARGVYGQRQQGVQMIRIKIPFGRLNTKQLRKISDISDEYSNGNLHLTTRQDIQIHHVSLDRTPELWAKLEQDDITLREACGNTVRNVTASAESGIDPKEAFDVSNYAYAVFNYFLRQPFCQELGRKVKIAFSNSEEDTAYTFIHDIGFIPKLNSDGGKGFKVLIGGGLGAQPFLAQTAYEFLPADEILTFVEGALRVFDRHGERTSRHKARMKYLIQKIGIDAFKELVVSESAAIIPVAVVDYFPKVLETSDIKSFDSTSDFIGSGVYQEWLDTNTFKQKDNELFAVYVKIQLGNIPSSTSRVLADIVETFADEKDIRITINQNFILKNIHPSALPHLFEALQHIGLAASGYGSVADITACPGTDTCNLAISNSTHISIALEDVIRNEYPHLVHNKDILIKISGCMNACGQHSLAQIGFHGSSFKIGTNVVPAVQLLLGGGKLSDGSGRISDKIIKVASKRTPEILRFIFDDMEQNSPDDESFNEYYDRVGKDYFYQLLKPLADNDTLQDDDYIDWGADTKFQTAIGVGECAGVVIDLVATLFLESEEKLDNARYALDENRYADSIYYSYAAYVNTAKTLLLIKDIKTNTQHGIINDFSEHFGNEFTNFETSFKETVLQINQHVPEKSFATTYLGQSNDFYSAAKAFKNNLNQLANV
ncbi:MAG: HEPN domain-containing protein [Saprospiraceae bacterium]|jgi:sulfite reductase (ferredoxin)|nr:HEPN domain-containing protein [Saprospiraceae bacterium]